MRSPFQFSEVATISPEIKARERTARLAAKAANYGSLWRGFEYWCCDRL
jgi:hypothetical protein